MLWPDLSDNPVVRSFPFAKVASKMGYEVEIIGTKFNGFYEVYYNQLKNDENITIKVVKGQKGLGLGAVSQYFRTISGMYENVSGEIVHVFKAWPNTIIPGVLHKFLNKKKIILDIEDFHSIRNKEILSDMLKEKKSSVFSKKFLSNLGAYCLHRSSEFNSRFYDKTIVSTYGLQRYFGGEVIPTCVNTDYFDPEKFDSDEIKSTLGLENKIVISFIGMPRPHKGVDILIDAYKNIKENYENVALLLVGGSLEDEYTRSVYDRTKKLDDVIFKESVPYDEIPDYVAATDIAVIPQLDSLFAGVQLPAKVFDSMAMEKPVVGTSVSDLPLILDNCGMIAKPNDALSLSQKISTLIEDQHLRLELGRNARKKCIDQYSWHWLGKKMKQVYEEC